MDNAGFIYDCVSYKYTNASSYIFERLCKQGNVLKCIEMIWNVLKCIEMYWNVLKWNVSKCIKMYQNVLKLIRSQNDKKYQTALLEFLTDFRILLGTFQNCVL